MSDASKPPIVFSRGLGFIKDRFSDYTVLEYPKEGLEEFVRDHCQDVRVVVSGAGRRLPPAIENLPNLGLLALVGSGFEGIGAEDYLARGIHVTHSPGGNAPDVADHAVALMLALTREVVVGDQRMRAGQWVDPKTVETVRSIRDLKIGILGMGAIGVGIAERMTAFGSKITWYGPNPKPSLPYPRAESLLQLATDSDVLFIAARADASNRGLIDQRIIDALGPKGVIVNVSRGSIIDQAAMIAALRSGALGGAALDVFDPEPVRDTTWADVPNTVLTPHIGGAGLGAWDNQVAMIRDNMTRFYAGQPMANPVPIKV